MSCIMVRDPSNIIRCFQGNSRSECMFSRFHLEDPFCIRSEYINCMKPLSLFFIIVEIRGLWIVDWPTWKTWVFLTFFLTFFLTLTFLRWNRKNHLFLVVYIVILTYLFVHALHFFFFFLKTFFTLGEVGNKYRAGNGGLVVLSELPWFLRARKGSQTDCWTNAIGQSGKNLKMIRWKIGVEVYLEESNYQLFP